MYLSSGEIPRPLEHVNRGAYVFITKVDPLSDARERFEDLQFAVEFNNWRVLNYLQFQEAVDLEGCLSAMIECLLQLRGAEIGSAGERESLSDLYAAAVRLEKHYSGDSADAGRHSLTAPSLELHTVGAPLTLSAFEVHGAAAPDVRSLLAEKLIAEIKVVMTGPLALDFHRFSGIMSVSSLRDVRHVLTASNHHQVEGQPWTAKVLITGTRLSEAYHVVKVIEDNREVAGWDITLPISTWNSNGWQIYTHATFEKLLSAKRLDDVLEKIYLDIAAACEVEPNEDTEYVRDLISHGCNIAAQRLDEAHAHELDFAQIQFTLE